MAYRIGIDAGSKTIKVVVVDEDGAIVRSVYQRHRAAVRDTLAEVLHTLIWRYGDMTGRLAITGSAGMGLAKALGLPFVQEVVATTKAVRRDIPDADAVIELGGEDAKVIYLTGGLEQRMNATCAGGTGGFIDTIAFMLGARSSQMSSLALGAGRTYPIASRCAVFAQTDVRRNAAAVLGWVRSDPARHAVVMAGRPYHMDPELLHGIDLAASRLGLAVLSPLGMGLGQLGPGPAAPPEWPHLARFHCLAAAAAADHQLELVCLEAFGCGFDAVNLELVRDELASAGKTFTALKLDDIVDLAHVRIRLRTLAESLEARPLIAPAEGAEEDGGHASALPGNVAEPERPSAQAAHLPGDVQVPAGSLTRRDLELVREKMPSGICVVAGALGAGCTEEGRGGLPASRLLLPRVCQGCLLESLPALLGRGSERATLSWASPAESSLCAAYAEELELPPRQEGDPLRIGILGNALLCFDPLLNDGLVEKLRELGCQPLLPDPRLLEDEDVAFRRQLRRFREQGADHVIYVQAFGCLKGHVQLRGAMHELAREFPELPITVIDYDPEASPMNRENRVRLAVEAARERGLPAR